MITEALVNSIGRYFVALPSLLSLFALPTYPLMARSPTTAIDLYAISDEFNTYHTPDFGERAVDRIIPIGSTILDATARLNTAGAYCLKQHKPGIVECGALISVVTGQDDLEPVRWSIYLTTSKGFVTNIKVELN